MLTLLQTLLLQTLPVDLDPVLLAYIETVLPAVEREFETIPAFLGSEADVSLHVRKLNAVQRVIYCGNNDNQSLLMFTLNSLLTAWNLLPFLSTKLLSDNEKRLLCLGITFQSYNKFCLRKAATFTFTAAIALGETLNLDTFWAEWRKHLPELAYLASTADQMPGKNADLTQRTTCKLTERRLLTLRNLLSFGTIAAQLSSPSHIVTEPEGNCLQALLRELEIDRTLIYHRLRSGTGLLTNSIHNALLHLTEKLDWQAILFFAEGVVYLAPPDSGLPDRAELQAAVWEAVSSGLASKMLTGEIGFKRDGKGLKVAPQTLEFLSPAQLIRCLPNIVGVTIRNETDPATPKRLKRLDVSPAEMEFLLSGADLRSDRIAEFIILLQKDFFGNDPEFITCVLDQLELRAAITPEQTQVHTGGCYWGWYHAAAYYVASNTSLNLEDTTAKLQELANRLVAWAEAKHLLPVQSNPTREVFDRYLDQYLEIPGWNNPEPSFQHELAVYVAAKTKAARQPLCSFSSGEFASEDQMDSVVLFKPQQYSNKNPLGGRQLKRGSSKIWSLEMLLRRAFRSIGASNLEERQPVFLYLFPAFVYTPQVTKAIRVLINQLKRVNLWEVRRFWQEHEMDAKALRFYPWLRTDPDPYEKDKADLPLWGLTYTTTKGKTTTEAWIEPAFLTIALPLVLGIKVVATASPVPLYSKGSEFSATAQVDGPVGFWGLLGLPTSLHLAEVAQGQVKHVSVWLDRLLIAYSIHLDCKANPPDPRWQAFPGTVQAISTDVLVIFSLAHSHFQTLFDDKVKQYWHFAQVWATGDPHMEAQLELTQRLVQEYRTFYRVHVAKSTHAIVLPLSKVLEDILSTPSDVPIETLILQTSGRLHDALRRQEPYKRPFIMDQSLSIEVRVNHELQAIHQFVTTCIRALFLEQYKGDRALLQEHRHRIKSGAEFAYRLLAMQEPKTTTKQQELEGAEL